MLGAEYGTPVVCGEVLNPAWSEEHVCFLCDPGVKPPSQQQDSTREDTGFHNTGSQLGDVEELGFGNLGQGDGESSSSDDGEPFTI